MKTRLHTFIVYTHAMHTSYVFILHTILQEAVTQGYINMLNNRVRPNLSKEFYTEPPIGLEIRRERFASLGAYISPKKLNQTWTKGEFIFDASRPHEL